MSDLSARVSATGEPMPFEIPTLANQIAEIDSGDPRRNRRAAKVIEQPGRQPRNSIPSAIFGWSETRSAYHLFSHDQVDAQKILEPHYHCTLERIKQVPVVRVAQDTTEPQTNPASTNSRDRERSTMKPGADSTCTPRWPSLRNDSHRGCSIPGVADATL